MINTAQISEGHNALRFQLEGQTFLRVYNAQKRLLVSFTGSSFSGLTFYGEPGAYTLESDGTLLEGQSVSVDRPAGRSIDVLQYFSGGENVFFEVLINGLLYSQSPKDLLNQNLLTLQELKSALIVYFENRSVQQRALLIPDHKMIYALMGVYPAHEKTAIEATVAKFQSEYVIAERQIKSAKTLEEVLAVRPQFPTELLGSVKKSVSRPKQTKK